MFIRPCCFVSVEYQAKWSHGDLNRPISHGFFKTRSVNYFCYEFDLEKAKDLGGGGGASPNRVVLNITKILYVFYVVTNSLGRKLAVTGFTDVFIGH